MNADDVYLRALEPEDIDFLLELENNPDYWEVSTTIIPFSRFQMEQYLINTNNDLFEEKQLRMIIVEKTSEKNVGCIDFYDLDAISRRAYIGVIVLNEFQKKSFGQQALKLMIDLAFEKLGLHSLAVTVNTHNTASIKLFEKLGFLKQGEKIDWVFKNGKFCNQYFYQLINNKDD
jgi:diamine N-acetyltransferase